MVKQNLVKAQNRMKQLADRHRSEREFAVGDWVYLKLQPFKQFTLVQQSSHKLSPKYCGPFQISKRVGPVAYQLRLPATARVHNVFHVCLLKKKWLDTDEAMQVIDGFPECLMQPGQPDFIPEKVLERKMVKFRNAPRAKWLIQWRNRTVDDASWEYADEIIMRFPTFQHDS